MHMQRFAILLLLATAAQANVIQNGVQQPKESKVTNEVPLAVEQGNAIVKQDVARPQQVSPVAMVPHVVQPHNKQPTVIAKVEATPVQQIKPAAPALATANEQLKQPNVVSNTIPKAETVPALSREPSNAIPVAAPASVDVQEQQKQSNEIPKVVAAPVAPAAPVPVPVAAKTPKTPVAPVPVPVAAKTPETPVAPVPVPVAAKTPETPVAPVAVPVAAKNPEASVAPVAPKVTLPAAAPVSVVAPAAAPVANKQQKIHTVVTKGQAAVAPVAAVANEKEKLSNVIPAASVAFVAREQEKQSPKDTARQVDHKQTEKLEGSNNHVANQAGAEPRVKYGYPDDFYIIDDGSHSNDTASNSTTPNSNSTTTHKHTHEHVYYKPALFPFPPPPLITFVSDSGAYGYGNKYGSGSNKYGSGSHSNSSSSSGSSGSAGNKDHSWLGHNKYGGSSSSSGNKDQSWPGFYPLPLLPIPFWKPGSVSSSQKYNSSSNSNTWGNKDDQLYSYKPNYYNEFPPFYINEKRGHADTEAAGKQPGLVLIGHIFLQLKVQGGKGETTDPSSGNTAFVQQPTASDGDKDDSSAKIEEPVHSPQLLLQPLVYPAHNQKTDSDASPLPNQINEIYRSLHVVHPSSQQRSQSPDVSEDGGVLFAVEIPKPIYRFFKSVFGVFSN
ncbi:hypothetical protein KR093_007729 [Drosophila rubida]|uniref:Uncharacterized protein n=1 Tax=Drosophila rubida TaxID=30044 RepID=A0AAD4JWE9_9MUSC|nr:hypothetical protein KR093_007729 [Drosophila rubida]